MTRKRMILVASGAFALTAVVGTAVGATAAGLGADRSELVPAALASTGAEPTPSDFTRPGPSGTSGGATPSGTPGTGITPGGPSGAGPATGDIIGHDQAVRIATAHAEGGRLDEIEREVEHGRTVWKVEFVAGSTEIEVYVDAATATVTKVDRDTDDGDDRDDDDGDDDSGGID